MNLIEIMKMTKQELRFRLANEELSYQNIEREYDALTRHIEGIESLDNLMGNLPLEYEQQLSKARIFQLIYEKDLGLPISNEGMGKF